MHYRFEITDPRFILGFFVLLGIVFMVIGTTWAHRTNEFRKSSLQADGRIVEMVNVGRGLYEPTFEFDDASGVRHRIHSELGSNPPAYEVGDRIQVLYRLDDPAGASIDSFLELWLGPGIFAILGVAFVSVSGFVWWYAVRHIPI